MIPTAFLAPSALRLRPNTSCSSSARHANIPLVCRRRRCVSMTNNTPSPSPSPPSDDGTSSETTGLNVNDISTSSTGSGRKMPVRNAGASTRKLVRNKPGMESSADTKSNTYADARAGDMVGAPKVGEGLGPRSGKVGVSEKKVTRAAAIQKSKGFADAWAEQNQGRVDVWLIIGAVTLLTPILILVWAVATGVIPTGGLFEE